MCEMRIKWTISDIYFINSFYQKKFNPNKILENQNNKSAISSVTALSLSLAGSGSYTHTDNCPCDSLVGYGLN